MQTKLLYLAIASLMVSNSLWAMSTSSAPLTSKEDTVIAAGWQSAKANLEHQKQCALFGAEDITNNFKITLAANTSDGVVCKLNLDQIPEARTFNQINNTEVSLVLPAKDKITDKYLIGDGYAKVSAPSGLVHYGYSFDAIGYTDYYNLVTPYIYSQLGVDADNCNFSARGFYYPLSARIVLKTTCNASVYGAVNSYMEASINGGPWIVDYGVVNQY